MYSCVRVLTPSGGTVPFTETVTGITDAATGTPFAVRTMMLLGGNTAAVNTLCYSGMASSNFAGDSSYHWDWGFVHDTGGGASGGGVCNDFGGKIASGAGGYGYPFMDTWPDIFFGGYIGGFGYVDNVTAGTFDITWDRRDRSGDSKVVLCVGGSDYDITVLAGATAGTISAPLHPLLSKPQAVIQIPPVFDTLGSGPASTGAGGTGFNVGWDTRDGDRGATYHGSLNQAGNSKNFWLDSFNAANASVTAWTDTSYTITGGTGGGGLQVAWCGDTVVAKAGHFACPSTDTSYSFNLGLNAKFVMFQTVGRTLAQAGTSDTSEAAGCCGWVDPALSQACFWLGDITVGNVTPIYGSRYLSNSSVVRTGHANGALTTFANLGVVTQLESSGDITLAFTATDGTTPEILWFAIGVDVPGSLTVRKVVTGPSEYAATTFDFTTTGGLTPSTFSLANGDTQVFADIPVGTYGVTETPVADWTIDYTVSNADAHDAIDVGAGEDVTVIVRNTYSGTLPATEPWKLYRMDIKPRKETKS